MNPLTQEMKYGICPLCGKDTCGSGVYNNKYRLNLQLWTGYPNTTVPERQDLTIDCCFKCRNKIYKAIKETTENIKAKHI